MDEKYKHWVQAWNAIIEQVRRVIPKENIYPLTILPPATVKEIEDIEKKLGYTLPATYRHTLLHFSKGVDFCWFMYDEVEETIPEEFEGLFSATIRWGIDERNLEDLEAWAKEMDARGNDEAEYRATMSISRGTIDPNDSDELAKFDREMESNWENKQEYRSSLHNKLKFMSVDNGDVIAFDLLADGEPSVVYWDHETEEVTYLAPSFHAFIDRLTELYCIGNESWQYAPFLTDNGLDADGENAKKWRAWFQSFLSGNE